MSVLYSNVAEFHVHNKNVLVFLRRGEALKQTVHQEMRTFGTMTSDIRQLRD